MAKRETTRSKAKDKPAGQMIDSFDLDAFIGNYIWFIVPLLVLVYYWFSTQSTGFYQDDEIGHFRNIRGFWEDPFSIMGNQPKPGWKILLVIPGLFGFPGVVLAHSLIAAFTVVATYYTGRSLKWKNASLGAVLLAVQPLFLQLSFRSYSEITAGLFAVLMIYFFAKERYILAALTSSYIFSIRQEFALVSIALGVWFLMKKHYVPFLLLGWTPVVLGLIGWLHTGNIMWLLDDMRRIGLGVEVPHKPFWHYFEAYPFIAGPVTVALFLVGYFAFLNPVKDWKRTLKAEGLLFFTFTVMWAWSVFSAWDVPNFGANPGHWRYVLSFSPLAALYAAKGFNVFLHRDKRRFAFSVLGLYALITLVFLSKETNGLIMLEQASYTNLVFVLIVLALFAAYAMLRILPAAVCAGLLLVAGVAYTATQEKPRQLDDEATTVKQAAEWYLAQSPEIQSRPLYGNHALFRYFADISISDKNRDRQMVQDSLHTAAQGSVIFWDSHYGNSQFGGDVPVTYFEGNPAYKLLHQIISPQQTFGVLVFEKVVPAGTADTIAAPQQIQPPSPGGEVPQ